MPGTKEVVTKEVVTKAKVIEEVPVMPVKHFSDNPKV